MIVLGPHRSGSSMAAEMLQTLGVHMGDNMLAPNLGNERGYWEDIVWVALHEELLASSGGGWQNPEHGLEPQKRARFLRFVRSVALAKGERIRELGMRWWGFKDPRAVLFAGWYGDALPSARFVVCRRGTPASAASLSRRHPDIDRDRAVAITRWYEQAIDRFVEDSNPDHFVLDYEACLEDPLDTAQRLAGWLGTTADPRQAAVVVEPSLRHFRADAQ